MLEIGRALMERPRLHLHDEPFMGLAPLLVEEVFNVVKILKSEGMTIILAEQNAFASLSRSRGTLRFKVFDGGDRECANVVNSGNWPRSQQKHTLLHNGLMLFIKAHRFATHFSDSGNSPQTFCISSSQKKLKITNID
jgi:ABC-type branched-subunit amino acid transport system ATPase component